MSIQEITAYKLFCGISGGSGFISLKSSNQEFNLELPYGIFTAYCQILQNERPVYFDTDKKALQTGAEPVGIPER
ncbi:hypothetical protein JEU11_07625 [Paraglaciecola chathamensis]|uniref:Uncharacterized protein n=1 Tax=Paraglaciecola chathamensis TaxID=368405 RepID=A0ABS0WCV8_9ALTE|nr:hypothetical protein [Paraglaciecola chathamensis]MBJ2136314.1 hypothetical protein [Paraglaciecola chathamensis]